MEANKINPANHVIYEAKLHWISFVFSIVFIFIGSPAVIFLLMLLYTGIGGLPMFLALLFSTLFLHGIIALIRNKRFKIHLTDWHLEVASGLLGKQTARIPLQKIESIYISKSLLARLLDFGALYITMPSATQKYVIAKPENLQNQIGNLLNYQTDERK